MNIDRIAPVLTVVLAILAIFVPMEYWPLLLLLVGLTHGALSPVSETSAQAMIYAAVIAVPIMGNNAEVVPVIGSYLNGILDNITIAICGYAISTLAMDIKSRAMG